MNINKPTDNVIKVFEDCISNFEDETFKAKLQSISSYIQNSTDNYEIKAASNSLYSLSPSTDVNGIVTMKEMKNVYENKLVKKKQPGRKYYDKLKLAAKNRKCPLCGERTVSSLDHVLPKTKYPVFAVSPINLIPACADCNKIKDTYQPTSSDTEIIHPYYDDISDQQYLFASVNEISPPSLQFYIKTSPVETMIEKRLKVHFNLFELNDLYSSHAAEELSGIQYRLSKLHRSNGMASVQEHLYEEYQSQFMNNKNSWKTAMYKALSESHWFCNGGFLF